MRIQEITEDYILFDNGNVITYDHDQDCCETNWADFMSIHDDFNKKIDFKEELEFEFVDGFGFRFGSNDYWIAVPCYSDQNGYYTSEIDIYYNDVLVPIHYDKSRPWKKPVMKHSTKPVLHGDCCLRIC